jgi:hypothetical protein
VAHLLIDRGVRERRIRREADEALASREREVGGNGG